MNGDITIVNGAYKPTYNWGAPSCGKRCSFVGASLKEKLFSLFLGRIAPSAALFHEVFGISGVDGPSWPVKPPCAWDCSYGGTRTKNSFHPESTHEEDQSIKVDQPVSELLQLVLGTVLLVQNAKLNDRYRPFSVSRLLIFYCFSDDLPMTFRCSNVPWFAGKKPRSVLQEIDLRICMGKWVRRALLHEAASLGAVFPWSYGWFRMENPKLFRKPPFADGISNDFPWKIAGFVVNTIGDFPFAAWNISRGHVQFWMHSQSWTPVTSWPCVTKSIDHFFRLSAQWRKFSHQPLSHSATLAEAVLHINSFFRDSRYS